SPPPDNSRRPAGRSSTHTPRPGWPTAQCARSVGRRRAVVQSRLRWSVLRARALASPVRSQRPFCLWVRFRASRASRQHRLSAYTALEAHLSERSASAQHLAVVVQIRGASPLADLADVPPDVRPRAIHIRESVFPCKLTRRDRALVPPRPIGI